MPQVVKFMIQQLICNSDNSGAVRPLGGDNDKTLTPQVTQIDADCVYLRNLWTIFRQIGRGMKGRYCDL